MNNKDYFSSSNTTLMPDIDKLEDRKTVNTQIPKSDFATNFGEKSQISENVTEEKTKIDVNKPYRVVIRRKIIDG